MNTQKKGGTSRGARPLSRSLRLYQKIAIVFVVLSLLLLFAVLYLSVSEAVIHVTSKREVVSVTSGVEVVAQPTAYGQVSGFIVEKTFEKARTFELPQEGGNPVEAKATGMVTLINETANQVDLVATTRFLSEEGVLFRLNEPVSVPPNSQQSVQVSADQPGRAGEIGPTQFTIPGLPAATQAVVYAVSVDPMKGGVQYIRAITQKDLDDAERTLKDEILEESKQLLREGISIDRFDGEVYVADVITKVTDGVPGTEQGMFNVAVTVKVTAIYYPKTLVQEYVAEQLYESIQEGFELTEVNMDGLQISVNTINTVNESANLHVYLDGEVVLANNHESLEVARFKRKSGEEVTEMLSSVPQIESASVAFTPFWLKRVPTLEDHIRVEIK